MRQYRLDNYITLVNTVEDYSTGELVVTNGTAEHFWGDVEEVKSPAVLDQGIPSDYTEGRIRDRQIIKITARYRDTENVDVGSELTFDDLDGTFSVYDKHTVEWKRYVGIMAQRTS